MSATDVSSDVETIRGAIFASRPIRGLERDHDDYDWKLEQAVAALDRLAARASGRGGVTEAALARVAYGHNDTCGAMLGDYPCSCGHDALRAALDEAEEEGGCEHDWVSARNEAVEEGLICRNCHALSPESAGEPRG